MNFKQKLIKTVFTRIWDNGLWVEAGVTETKCGSGSTIKHTETVRDALEKIIDTYNVRTITDAACGDLNWISKMNLDIDKYVGYDIVDEIINTNIAKYQNEIFSFKCDDIISAALPKSDLIICRYCLQHLTTLNVEKVIENFKKSGSTYLLATSHLYIDINKDAHWINLENPPFNLPKPLLSIKEDNNPQDNYSFICLWRISDI